MTKAGNYRHLFRYWQSRGMMKFLKLIPAYMVGALFLVTSQAVVAQDIMLLRGLSSTRDAAELNYVESSTKRISAWLDALGLEHQVLDDHMLSRRTLSSTRVLLLAYNPTIPRSQVSALKAFLHRDGKLIVFYSSDQRLAKLMGMRLGEYKLEAYPGQWSKIQFLDAAPDALPSAVAQHSRNIRPVYPDRRDAQVIARWVSADGRAQRDPAWVLSSHGAWMTHVFLDGDTKRKQQILLGMIAHFYPPILEKAATHAVRSAGTVGPYRDYHDFASTIRRTPMPKTVRTTVSQRLSGIDYLYTNVLEQYRAKNYAAVLQSAPGLKLQIVDVYARSQPSRSNEVRALWEHSGMGLHPGDWKRTMRTIKNAGFTDLLTNMLWPGEAQFKSRVTPQSETVTRYGDQLAQCLAAARSTGTRVHLWKICWNLGHAPEPMVSKLRKERRLQQSHNGATINWLCPSHIQNQDMEIESIADALSRYKVDGLHLDYIRYKDSSTCYCHTCRAGFEQQLGRRIRSWPREARSGELQDEYRAFRRETITMFVHRVKDILTRIRPKVKLSAAVYGSYPSCRDSIAQDWAAWISNDLVDQVYPMNYLGETSQFLKYVHQQMALPHAKTRIYPGIGVTASESRLDAVDTIEQIQAARRAGASGFALYELNSVLREEILPALRLGVTSQNQ